MKYSKQREIILDALLCDRTHPTAGELYDRLKKEYPKLSLGTVYRNLNVLTDTGSIKRLSFPGQSDRFDVNTDEHFHLMCEKCGKVEDVTLSHLAEMDREVLHQTGFQVGTHQIVLKGLCRSCNNKKREGE